MDRDEVEDHKLSKKNGFFIWLSGKFLLRDTVGSPERARWLPLASLGSQSQRVIWFILPTRRASHIINRVKEQFQRSYRRFIPLIMGPLHKESASSVIPSNNHEL